MRGQPEASLDCLVVMGPSAGGKHLFVFHHALQQSGMAGDLSTDPGQDQPGRIVVMARQSEGNLFVRRTMIFRVKQPRMDSRLKLVPEGFCRGTAGMTNLKLSSPKLPIGDQ